MINYFNNRDYQMGFDAHSLGEPLDKAQSEAWQIGWHGWADIMDKSESAQPYFWILRFAEKIEYSGIQFCANFIT